MPLVSVIVPAYNAEEFLSEAIESVLEQSYSNWELLIVNDGSVDGTAELLQAIQDDRIRVFHQVNKGVAVARNLGLAEAKGDFLTFLDADDKLPPKSLARRVEEMSRRPELGILAGAVEKTSLGGEPLGFRWTPEFEGRPARPLARLDGRVFYGIPLFLRAELCVGCLFEPGLTHSEDLLFFLDVAVGSHAIYGSISDVVYTHRTRNDSAMSDLDGLKQGYRKFFERVWGLEHPDIYIRDKIYLKYRYVRILFLSYLRARSYREATTVLGDLIGLRL